MTWSMEGNTLHRKITAVIFNIHVHLITKHSQASDREMTIKWNKLYSAGTEGKGESAFATIPPGCISLYCINFGNLLIYT